LKVNISYAVELEDVPVEVGKLLSNVASYMAVLLNDVEEVGAANPTKAIDSIAKIRSGLADLDLRLADCSNILSGYVDVQNRVSTGTLAVDDGVDDESAI
tara:strand:+ start:1127 stop:1426 length:300 start_codon:yes stop_codon:yes gene_type:complete